MRSSAARPNPSETNSSFFLRQKAIETPIERELTWIVTESGASPQKRRAAKRRTDDTVQLTASRESGKGPEDDKGSGLVPLRLTRVTPGRILPASQAAMNAATTRAS